MVNYGNSKALVQVNENRPGNPAYGDGQVKSAWGQTGTMLEGQPLAIEYNANVLEDRPTLPEMISEEHPTGETPHEVSKSGPPSLQNKTAESDRKPERKPQPPQMQQQDGFFITAHDGIEMQAQDGEEGEPEQQPKEGQYDGYEEQEWTQEEAEEELREPSLDEFGKWKMEKFKAFARDVLVRPNVSQKAREQTKGEKTEEQGTQMTADMGL